MNEEKGKRKKGKEASSCTFSAQCQLEATSNKQQATSEKDRRSSCSTRCPLNPTPLQQCTVKPNTCMYSVHSKKSCLNRLAMLKTCMELLLFAENRKWTKKKQKNRKGPQATCPPATCHIPHALLAQFQIVSYLYV